MDADDSIQELYNRFDSLMSVFDDRLDTVLMNSFNAYAFLLEELYAMGAQEGWDITPLEQKLEASFKTYKRGGREHKILSSLKEYMDSIESHFDAAEALFGQIKEKRLSYYKSRESGDNKTADKLKGEFGPLAPEIKSQLDDAELLLNGFTVEYAEKVADEFVESFNQYITAVPTVAADDREVQAPWFTIDGRRLVGQPQKKGVYIHDGKTIMVK